METIVTGGPRFASATQPSWAGGADGCGEDVRGLSPKRRVDFRAILGLKVSPQVQASSGGATVRRRQDGRKDEGSRILRFKNPGAVCDLSEAQELPDSRRSDRKEAIAKTSDGPG